MSLFEFTCSVVQQLLYRRTPGLYRAFYSCYKRVCDRNERDLCRLVIKPGMTVADIGANIGIYSDFFSDLVGAEGEVHAFEPDPTNFRLLKEALSLKRNVTLNHCAVGDRDGSISLYVSPALNVDHRTYDSGGRREKITVRSTSLDSHFDKGKQVDFVKMDIQGFEYQALLGMKRVLQDNRDVNLLFEYFPSGLQMAGADSVALKTFLAELGFSLYEIRANGTPIPLETGDPPLNRTGYTNIFATRNP